MESVEELCDYITLINRSENILSGRVDDIQMAYRQGLFEIVFNGSYSKLHELANQQMDILETKETGHHLTARIKAKGTISGNEIIARLLPAIEIFSFREVLPSMNDIFIETVERKRASIN
jgi:ABC-2 type transport system ATP-binding protein